MEVHDCTAAFEYLPSYAPDVIVVLLHSAALGGLQILRQQWDGPLICFCDEDEDVLSALESANALAILPPFATSQVVHLLRFFAQMGRSSSPQHPKRSARQDQGDEYASQNGMGHVEQELRESERRLEQAQRMEAVGRLAGGIAHDFNNLLTVIGSYSELALRKLDGEPVVARYVEQIRKASANAATLTRQLLAFSRRQVLQPRVIVLNEIVEEIAFMVQSLLGARIELRLKLDPELGKIEADPMQLQQVLLNLIVNAKDAMPDGGLLYLETRNLEVDSRYAGQFPGLAPGAYVRLTVADTGIGMDEQTLSHIYEPFFTTKPKGHGTGLGLPTVYGIVQQSHGHITVYSEVGKGTTFHVYLPRVDKMMEAEHQPEAAANMLRGVETVLVVEDEQGVRELASTILREAGYHLLIAATPEEAIELEKQYEGTIDVLLTDVIMPRMTGREVALSMAYHRPQMTGVYMSGYTEDVMAFQRLFDTGAYLIEKPFYPNDLLRTVRRAIEQPLSHERLASA
jgi:signal transduction histidine kinase